MLLPQNARRLAIFAYYDADGLVDDYVPYLLERVGAFCTRQIVMVNGSLTPEGEAKIAPWADRIVYRANEGYDVTGYKEGVLSERAHWPEYDEVLFYNQTIFGPVCPLDAMFADMAQRDVDFWGLSRHKGAPAASWDPDVPILPHVQSFFFAVRSRMLCSRDFLDYWEQLPSIRTYWDAVGKHEVVFTDHFAKLGYTWDVYVHTGDLEMYNDYPLMGMPVTLLKERGCPFFKRKSFITPQYSYTTVPQGQAAQMLYDYIRLETQYPIALAVQNILRTAPLGDIDQSLALYYSAGRRPACAGKRTAVLYFAGQPMAELLCAAAHRLGGAACIALFADDALCEAWRPRLPAGARAVVTHRPGPACMLDELWDAVSAAPYVLYLSSDMPQLLEQFADLTSMERALEGLADPGAISVLEEDPCLGLLLPVMPGHQETLTMDASLAYQGSALRAAAARLGLALPDAEEPTSPASRGGMFLARTAALAPLAHKALEPALFDGIYPLWEFLPPLAAQKAGFLTGYAVSEGALAAEFAARKGMFDHVARMWITPHRHDYGNILFRMDGIRDFYYERRFQMTLQQAFEADLTFRQKMWICLQILLTPAAFARLHRLLGGHAKPRQLPRDMLD